MRWLAWGLRMGAVQFREWSQCSAPGCVPRVGSRCGPQRGAQGRASGGEASGYADGLAAVPDEPADEDADLAYQEQPSAALVFGPGDDCLGASRRRPPDRCEPRPTESSGLRPAFHHRRMGKPVQQERARRRSVVPVDHGVEQVDCDKVGEVVGGEVRPPFRPGPASTRPSQRCRPRGVFLSGAPSRDRPTPRSRRSPRAWPA